MSICTCHDVLIVKNLNRWFKEKWVDVSRKDKDGKHPPCGRSKAKKGSKGYPKCRPSVKVSSKTPKTAGSMSEGEKRAATKRKRSKKQGVGGKPTIVKSPMEDDRDIEIYELAVEAMALGLADNWADAMDIARQEAQTGIHPGNQTPGVHPAAPELAPTRQYFPTTLVHEDASEGIQRRVNPFTEEGTFEGLPFKDYFRRSEPMDLAWRLLKDEETHPNWGQPTGGINLRTKVKRPTTQLRTANYDGTDNTVIADGDKTATLRRRNDGWEMASSKETNVPFNEETGFTRSEPMDIAMRLLKDAVSPEAKRHKLEYDKKYESSPERVKYREELNRERRKRGIYGHGGPDMSHTKDHTLVAESPHANRARHFKERGTLKG